MASYPPPQPFPPNVIYNPTNWIYSNNSFTIQDLEALFLLKSGDTATGLINFASGIIVETSAFFNTTLTVSNGVNTNTLSATQWSGNSATASLCATATNATTADTATVSLTSRINAGGSNTLYLAMVAGNVNNGTYPILVNLPTYNATSTVLTAPIIDGTSYITSPLLTTTPNGTVRVASTTGQYSYFQQSSVGYDLNLTMPPAGSCFNIFGGGVGTLPTANNGSGLGFGWSSVPSSGSSDYINYAQGGNGGHNFWSVNTNTNSTLIGSIPRFQPPFDDTSTTNIPTNYWVQNAITTAISGGGGATLGGSNTFTAQNIFNNFCPQSPIAPTVNNSLINLQYLNSVLTTNGIQNYNLKNPFPLFTTQQNSTFNSIQIQIPQSQFTSSAPPYKCLKIRFNYILTGNSNNLMITNSGILNLYPLNTTSPTNTPNYSYVGAGGGVPFNNPPNEYKYNITNNMYTSTGTLSNSYNALYTDDYGLANLKRWYYVSNVNGGSPSGFSGTPYFSYLSYGYDGAGGFSVGFTTPPSPMPITSNPTYTGDPSYGTATQLNLNIFMEVISNDFLGSTVVLQYNV